MKRLLFFVGCLLFVAMANAQVYVLGPPCTVPPIVVAPVPPPIVVPRYVPVPRPYVIPKQKFPRYAPNYYYSPRFYLYVR